VLNPPRALPHNPLATQWIDAEPGSNLPSDSLFDFGPNLEFETSNKCARFSGSQPIFVLADPLLENLRLHSTFCPCFGLSDHLVCMNTGF